MARGNITLAEASGAFLLALVLAAIVYYSGITGTDICAEALKKDLLRLEFYRLIRSGRGAEAIEGCISGGQADAGSLTLSLYEPLQGPYLVFYTIKGGGVTKLYVAGRG